MYDFVRNNKGSGIYWIKQSVDDLKIKITIKPQPSVVNLPKYEDFISISNTVDLQKIETDNTEEYIFKWQEKVFNIWEINYYNDIHNCVGDNELDHHDRINSTECKPQKVFTYIHEDYHLPLPTDSEKVSYPKNIFNLDACLETLQLGDRIGGLFEGSTSMHHLFRSEASVREKSKWIAMHVVFDDSLYSDDCQLLLKREYMLVSLYYNMSDKYLIITPDTNDLAQNPYNVDTKTDASPFQYGVEIIFSELDDDEELVNLLNKLYKKWEKKHKQLIHFTSAPVRTKKYYVTVEIMSATDFDLDHIYIEYEIKLPDDIKCENTLRGRTHISKAARTDDGMLWTYGHTIELELEISDEIETSPLQLFFEAISTDWWGRHRTEGYCYFPLPLTPGHFAEELSCVRPEERNKVEADSRRFFVGGCHLIKDLEVLSKPQDANFTYTATGSIQVRWGTIKQGRAPGYEPAITAGSSSASVVLQSAEAVLRKYSQARARLDAATKDLAQGDGY